MTDSGCEPTIFHPPTYVHIHVRGIDNNVLSFATEVDDKQRTWSAHDVIGE